MCEGRIVTAYVRAHCRPGFGGDLGFQKVESILSKVCDEKNVTRLLTFNFKYVQHCVEFPKLRWEYFIYFNSYNALLRYKYLEGCKERKKHHPTLPMLASVAYDYPQHVK
jgi:hypothetical protein